MLTPGSPIHIEISGRAFQCQTLTRRQQRELLAAMRSISDIDTNADKLGMMEHFFDVVDRVIEICCPNESEERKDSLGPVEAMEMAGKLVARHFGGSELKKKLESPLSSGAASYAKPVQRPARTGASESDAQFAANPDPAAWTTTPAPNAEAAGQSQYPNARINSSDPNWPRQ